MNCQTDAKRMRRIFAMDSPQRQCAGYPFPIPISNISYCFIYVYTACRGLGTEFD